MCYMATPDYPLLRTLHGLLLVYRYLVRSTRVIYLRMQYARTGGITRAGRVQAKYARSGGTKKRPKMRELNAPVARAARN